MGLFFKREKVVKRKWGNFSGNVNIYNDLNEADIPRLFNEEGIHSIQFFEFKTPSIKTWEVLNTFYEKYPNITLRFRWYETINFDFLQYLPAVKRISISSFLTKDYSPLVNFLDLEELGIEETKSTAVDVSFISNFSDLRKLYIDGMKKGLDSISMLDKLEVLTLRGVKLSNIEIIRNLKNIKELNLLFGSYKNLDAISTQKKLEHLEISRTRQIPNYDFLGSLINLKFLCFEGMSQMERIPSLKGLESLKKIQIQNNRSLKDIIAIKDLTSLEELLLFFPENFKASMRKELSKQALQIIKDSETIKSTNLWREADSSTKEILKEKGIDFWGYNPELEKMFDKK